MSDLKAMVLQEISDHIKQLIKEEMDQIRHLDNEVGREHHPLRNAWGTITSIGYLFVGGDLTSDDIAEARDKTFSVIGYINAAAGQNKDPEFRKATTRLVHELTSLARRLNTKRIPNESAKMIEAEYREILGLIQATWNLDKPRYRKQRERFGE